MPTAASNLPAVPSPLPATQLPFMALTAVLAANTAPPSPGGAKGLTAAAKMFAAVESVIEEVVPQLASAEEALAGEFPAMVQALLHPGNGSTAPSTTPGEPAAGKRRGQTVEGPDLGTILPPAVHQPVPAPAVTAAPNTASAPAALAQQVAMHLAPLRKGPDGTHRLTIHLNPADLGTISVVAEVRNGAIAVQIHGATEAGRAALHAALPELRRDLVEAGFGSCSLDLQQGGPGQGQAHRSWEQPGGNARHSAPPRQPMPAPAAHPEPGPTAEVRAVDLRV